MQLSEQSIQRQILDYLKAKEILHWRMPIDGIRSGGSGIRRKSPLKGFPDIAGLLCGLFFGIEVKREKGKLSTVQNDWAFQIVANGGTHLTARSLQDVVEFIETLEKSREDL